MKQYEFMPGTRVRYHRDDAVLDCMVVSNVSTPRVSEYELRVRSVVFRRGGKYKEGDRIPHTSSKLTGKSSGVLERISRN